MVRETREKKQYSEIQHFPPKSTSAAKFEKEKKCDKNYDMRQTLEWRAGGVMLFLMGNGDSMVCNFEHP